MYMLHLFNFLLTGHADMIFLLPVPEPSGEDSHEPGSSGFLTNKQTCSEYPR